MTHEVAPLDEANRALLAHVHPADWKNPQPQPRYDLVVLGAGTAGLVSASIAAALGAKVALVERALMGGDCLNYGCVPSKAVIRAARAWHEARNAQRLFGGPAAGDAVDFGAAMRRMREVRASIAPHDGAARFAGLGIDVFLGQATFTAQDAVRVGDATLRFKRAIVATGARAFVPPIPGVQDAGVLTNETIFSLTELPRSLVVVGAGPIGLEMAQSFARFGSQVTVVDRAARIMARDDADAAAIVHRSLERDGVRFVLDAGVSKIERRGAVRVVHVTQGERALEIEGEQVLVAVGRAANVDGLGLEAAHIDYDRGGVNVDDRMRTTNRRVFAIGDVASKYKFTHAADAQARFVVQNALFLGRQRASSLVIPWTTYTSPEVAHTGLTLEDANAQGVAIDTLHVPLSGVDRAILDGETEGFVKVHVAKGSDRILGATIVAEHAGEMISELTTAIVAGVGLDTISSSMRPYPTQAEAIRRAADQHRRRKLTPFAARALRFLLKFVR